jgi:tetratricopeptide (TPR) repeat protein
MSLEDHLRSLETSDLIRIGQLEPDLEYLFKHALVQDAAYSSILKQDRRALHSDVAMVLEKLHPERLDELAPVLAHHLDRAEDHERALAYYIRAGDLAAARFASAEAVMSYTRALEIARANHINNKMQHLYSQLGHVHEHVGQHEQARDVYLEMEEQARQLKDKEMELASLILNTTLHANYTAVYNLQKAQEYCDRALKLARKLGDKQSESSILWNQMHITRAAGNSVQAVEYGEQALSIARELDLREQMAFALNDLAAHGYLDLNQFDKALERLQEAHDLWIELDNQPMLTDNLNTQAMMYSFLGDYDRSLEQSAKGREISGRINNPWGIAYSYWAKGDIEQERGQIDTAIESLTTAIDLAHRAMFMGGVVGQGASLAMLYGHLGMPERGVPIASEAAAIGMERQIPFWQWPKSVLARLMIRLGELDEADTVLKEVEDRRWRVYPAAVMYELARIELACGRKNFDEALVLMEGLEKYINSGNGQPQRADATLLKVKLLQEVGKLAEAREAVEAGIACCEKLNARRCWWQLLGLLAEIDDQAGDAKAAEKHRAEAMPHLQFVLDNISDAELKNAFMATPDVKKLMGQ